MQRGARLNMRWPWQRSLRSDQVVVSWSGGTFAFVRARPTGDGVFAVKALGVERMGSGGQEELVQRLQALGLKGLPVHAMLRPEQYQLLQIDTPPVAPEELRSAARFQIREMVNAHMDDITLDVMHVGDGQNRGTAHLFVVAARNDVIREVLGLGNTMGWTISVIDIQETAQRNLQTLLARDEGLVDRADAALLISDTQQALLTISANEELFLARRLEVPQGFHETDWDKLLAVSAPLASDTYTPVSEYVPEYAGGGVGSMDYGHGAVHDENDRMQRLVVEVQRSLDLWDRTWSSMPLSGLRVYLGGHSEQMASWLGRELGQSVTAMDFSTHFTGLEDANPADLAYCLPLLGVLLRVESRKL